MLDTIDAELIVAEDSSVESLTELAKEHQVRAIMTNWANVPASVIDGSPACKIVTRLGIGLDNIDVAHCTNKGIVVTNVPEYCLLEVAEHALALIFALGRKVAYYHAATKNGIYDLQAGPVMRQMHGQTLGIVGLGNTGKTLAQKANALGFRVLALARGSQEAPAGVEFVDRQQLLAESDYISLHLPLKDDTKNMVDADWLAAMKPTAYLINTARGGVVDHQALSEALASNQIAGAGLDVQVPEPPDLSQAPYNHPNVIVTPHAAFTSVESIECLRRTALQDVVDHLSGRTPKNVVNG
jgi:D-3-phosphoglycerate dehydrogenase